MMEDLILGLLLAMLVVIAVAVVRQRRLFSAALLTGIYSFVSACWMTMLDAPDVAFTEAAVGAGMSTVLFLAALSLTTNEVKTPPLEKRPVRSGVLPLIVVTVTGAALVWATYDMPLIGAVDAPQVTSEIYDRYVNQSAKEIGVPNTVTSVLASYRGYDTMGETAVVFTAGLGVLILLSGARRRSTSEEDAA